MLFTSLLNISHRFLTYFLLYCYVHFLTILYSDFSQFIFLPLFLFHRLSTFFGSIFTFLTLLCLYFFFFSSHFTFSFYILSQLSHATFLCPISLSTLFSFHYSLRFLMKITFSFFLFNFFTPLCNLFYFLSPILHSTLSLYFSSYFF